MREIEVKIRAENLKEVEKKLLDLGCKLSEPIRQEDVIYSYGNSTSEWEESKEGHIVLRLRREKGKAMFNMKQQRSNELDNIEYETEVKDPEAIHQILLILGYTPKVEVKKNRRKGKFHGYEICLDEVEKLGSFVELEKLTEDSADPAEVQEELFQTLESLGLSRKNQETRGYDTQMYQLEHKK
ncbi:MAG: Adenylyl cyclase CyaB [Candidatus Jorgensenbacteria bacterium GW2011_GWA1_48_13]|uniref:Adenylyl cyclase CyaB n=1 Tax=Candidatus Jorgensenbacteria bacterium GW2011_GWB1_50_10 TaxID=1618665 RepID=A0A0G1W8I9_9BACT|nr:MAG: Adenylyl cyclase CyaB [Candidatus Jorgensenbacteria bacterium GW2011_GWA1_48_13]KKW15096.1 MAG: Adenylyl cyclase CyaB [Candidatus Jorgensenbacteria bacterium GW2011_GWB1_50_10]